MWQKVHWNGPWARGAKWGGGVLAVVGVVGFLVAPPVVRSVAESALTQALHRPVSIEGVSINPYALSAEVRGLRIDEPGGGVEAASFKALYANLEAESLFRGGVVVKEVQLIEPHVSVIRTEVKRYNWSDLIDEILNKPDDGSKTFFSVHNIRVEHGRVDFDDRPTGQKHTLADLNLGVPFVSNLPSQVETYVEPLLAVTLDGAPFEVRGKARPFSKARESAVELRFEGVDLTPYLAYVPLEKPFRVPSARLSSNLVVTFAQPDGQAPDVAVKGEVGLDAFELQDTAGHPAVKLPHVAVGIERLAPLAGVVSLGTVTVERPEVVVDRDRDGRLGLLKLVPKPAPSSEPPSPAAAPSDTPPARPLAVTLGEFRLTGGKVMISDALPGGTYRRTLDDLHVSLRKFDLAGAEPAALDAGFHTDLGESVEHVGTVGLAPLRAEGTITVDRLDLPGHAAYYAAALKQADVVSGHFDGKLAYAFSIEKEAPRVSLKGEVLGLKDLVVRLKGEKAPLAKVGTLELRELAVDTAARKVDVGEVIGKATRLALIRDGEGRFNAERMTSTEAVPPPAPEKPVRAAASKAPKAVAAGPAWQVAVRRVTLDDWGVRIEDQTLSPAIVFNAEPLSLRVEGLSTAKGSKAKVELKASINKRGRFGVAGTVGLAPLAAALDLDLSAVDLAMLQPYVTEKVNIAITRGVVTSKGRLAFELPDGGAMKGGFKGSLTIGDFASVDKLNAADFLKWRSLYFGGVDVRLAPLAVNVDEIALTNFYTRLILDEQGGLNIREITAERARDQKRAKDAARAAGKGSNAGSSAPPAPVAAKAVAAPAAPTPPPPVTIRRITLQGGNIAYSDRFVKPNYDANLTGMGGVLSGLSSDPSALAELDLRGRVDNAAPVEVSGRLNPFRQDKALDIRASVTDFELSGVSTYAAKYVGYGIEKGKLSAKLNYKVEDRKLTASNQVFLDQLTFGDQVDSPDALKLPVQLAVSLLKNSRGEIDLDLPISGTLDDPQFSVGGIIVKVIVNLIGKALTSPFALLGSLFGGNAEELAWLEFDPGFARIGEKGESKLKAIAKAMSDRPGIKLEISGRVDPDADRDGLRRAAMLGRVEALKVKEMARKGEAAGEDGRVRVDPAEYPVLLARVYKDADFVKPRTMLGLTKDLPVPEMEKLLIANAKVTDEDLLTLAHQRAQVVKSWLIEQGKVAGERVFILAPRVGKGGKDVSATLSRVDFSMR